MIRETQELLEAFDHLPEKEKRAFLHEVLHRLFPFESGSLTDNEISVASAALFKLLDEVTLSPEQEQLLDQRWNEYLKDPSQAIPWVRQQRYP